MNKSTKPAPKPLWETPEVTVIPVSTGTQFGVGASMDGMDMSEPS